MTLEFLINDFFYDINLKKLINRLNKSIHNMNKKNGRPSLASHQFILKNYYLILVYTDDTAGLKLPEFLASE